MFVLQQPHHKNDSKVGRKQYFKKTEKQKKNYNKTKPLNRQ